MTTIPDALAIALQHHQIGQLQAAEQIYRQILEVEPEDASTWHLLGVLKAQTGEHETAVAYIRRALAVQPNWPEAQTNLGNALREQGKLDEAVAVLRQAVQLQPDSAWAHNHLGIALKNQGKLDEAIICYRWALELKPDYAEAHSNLGNALNDLGHLDEASACFRRAVDLKPDFAEAHVNQSLLSLLSGDFEGGWRGFEWRWKTNMPHFQRRSFAQPLWDGQPLAGKTILLYAEQGLGDAIQFVRYIPMVKQHGGAVTVECPAPLFSLFKNGAGIDRLVRQGDELPAFDLHASLLSLPGIFRTSLRDIPAAIPYLFADPTSVKQWQEELGGSASFKIGIAWQGNPKHAKDLNRSIPLGCFEPLARCSGIQLLSLQKGTGVEQLQQVAERFPVAELGSRLQDMMETAAVMRSLDLVIACDTAVAHLAGALGVPVWVALPYIPDWRWLLDGSDSPWYPTMRLFRQDEHRQWQGVFRMIEIALREHMVNRAPSEERGDKAFRPETGVA